MTDTAQTAASGISRRSIAKGAAWATPAIMLATAAPAMAASPNVLVSPQMYQRVHIREPEACDPITNPQKGFIDSLCGNPPYYPPVGNCGQVPGQDKGLWLESDSGQAVQAQINSAEVTYTFDRDVWFPGRTTSTGNAHSGYSPRWNTADVLQSGWTVASRTSRSITLRYSGSGLVDVSTGAFGTGFATGYFINYQLTSGCYGAGLVSVTTRTSVTYTDASGTDTTAWTNGPTPITG